MLPEDLRGGQECCNQNDARITPRATTLDGVPNGLNDINVRWDRIRMVDVPVGLSSITSGLLCDSKSSGAEQMTRAGRRDRI